MSLHSVQALRAAVRAALVADATLTAALGGERIYDAPPRSAATPYVTFADAQWRDWSTFSDKGGEQMFTLDIWTDDLGLGQALGLADQIAKLLDTAPLALEGHRLVDLKFNALETRRQGNGRFARASLRFRAITETL